MQAKCLALHVTGRVNFYDPRLDAVVPNIGSSGRRELVGTPVFHWRLMKEELGEGDKRKL